MVDNKNSGLFFILVLAAIVGAAIVFGSNGLTGRQTGGFDPEPVDIINAHQCNADNRCEITNALVSNNLNLQGEILPEGNTCDIGQLIYRNDTNRWQCGGLGAPLLYGSCRVTKSSFVAGQTIRTQSCNTAGTTLMNGGVTCSGPSSIKQSHPIGGGSGQPPFSWYGECSTPSNSTFTHEIYIVCCEL